jgi:hypothetical protein
MAATSAEAEATTASDALRQPIRVRILEVLNTRDTVSAVQFVREGMGRGLPRMEGRSFKAQLSQASYHFRWLAEAGCIEVAFTRPVRGTEEHFYRARSRAYLTEEEWSALGLQERVDISKTMLTGFIAQAEGAMLAGTFDSRVERCLAWVPFQVDGRGWDELTTAIHACFAEVEQIRRESADRLASEENASAIPATFGIFGFESPPVPAT